VEATQPGKIPESHASSAAKCHEIFCRRLLLERHYDSVALLASNPVNGLEGEYSQPATDFAFRPFTLSLSAQAAVFTGRVEHFLNSLS
jgi:hypothetical protein